MDARQVADHIEKPRKFTKIHETEPEKDQRIFEDGDGNMFFVDWSGRSPEHTDDGPLEIVLDDILRNGLVADSCGENGPRFTVRAFKHRESDFCQVWCGIEPALFLATRLRVKVKLKLQGHIFVYGGAAEVDGE